MGLMDALRKAEEQGKTAARRGIERAREQWEDAERRVRRRMRIFPGERPMNSKGSGTIKTNQSVSNPEAGAEPLEDQRDTALPRPIVSINGKDVEKPQAPNQPTSDKSAA